MMCTRIVSTLAALCVLVGVGAGSARAADPQPAQPVVKHTGLYGAIGWGVGLHDIHGSVDDSWRMHVWWRPFNFTAVEVGYINAGEAEGGDDIDGLHLALVPILPAGNLDLFGKVGTFLNEADTNWAVGVGAAWHIWNGIGLRADWDSLNIEDTDGVNVVTLSLFYHLAKQGR